MQQLGFSRRKNREISKHSVSFFSVQSLHLRKTKRRWRMIPAGMVTGRAQLLLILLLVVPSLGQVVFQVSI
jgi:hypothetical protein